MGNDGLKMVIKSVPDFDDFVMSGDEFEFGEIWCVGTGNQTKDGQSEYEDKMIWRKCRKGFSDFPGEIDIYYESDGNFMDEEEGKAYSKTIRVSDVEIGKIQIRPIKKTPYEEIPLSNIKITKEFQKSLPQSWKILRQLEHYKQYGKFDNKIIVDEKMYLRDGYTQYLVAKMLGIANVTVYIKVNQTVGL